MDKQNFQSHLGKVLQDSQPRNHLEIYNYQHGNKIFRISSLAKLRNGPSLLNASGDKKRINNIQFLSFYCKYFVENGSCDSDTVILSFLRPTMYFQDFNIKAKVKH